MNRAASLSLSVFAVLSLVVIFLGLPVAIIAICILERDRLGTWGLVGGGFVALLSLIPLVGSLLQRPLIRRRRRKILATRPPMSDEQFLAGLDVPAELHPICVKVRKALAGAVGLPAELLDPAETLEEYGALQVIGPDEVEIMVAVENELGFTLSKEMEKPAGKFFLGFLVRADRVRVGQFAAGLTVWLVEHLPDLKPRARERLSEGEP